MPFNADEFLQVAARRNLTVETQRDILLVFAADHFDYDTFNPFLTAVLDELSPPPAPTAEAPQPDRVGVNSPALQQHLASEPDNQQPANADELVAFIDHSLLRASLEPLMILNAHPAIDEVGTGTSPKWYAAMPQEQFTLMQSLLDGSVQPAVDQYKDCDLIGGFKMQFPDGDWAAFTAIYSQHGIYIDAYLVLSEACVEQNPTWMPPSLEPVTSIAGDFCFEYPDGTMKRVRLTC